MNAVTQVRQATTVIERRAKDGAMPPLHARDQEETYRLIEGAVTFYIDDEVVTATSGDVVVATAGAARSFRVESAQARWLVETSVASIERYLDFNRAVATPPAPRASGWTSFEELAALTAIAAANGIELLGPPGAVPGEQQA